MTKSHSKKILVVDDSESNRLLLSFMLQELGYQTDDTDNGEKAVEMALEFDYSALFMDINMPIMDGLEATKVLRSINFDKPIFACSAEDEPNKIKKFMNLGFTGYICKPIEAIGIQALLEQHSITSDEVESVKNENYQNKLDQLSKRFVENIPVILTKIDRAVENNSIADLKRIGHKLKGTASQFGFDRVAKIGRDIETAINKSKIPVALEKAIFLKAELNKIRKNQ